MSTAYVSSTTRGDLLVIWSFQHEFQRMRLSARCPATIAPLFRLARGAGALLAATWAFAEHCSEQRCPKRTGTVSTATTSAAPTW